MNVNKAETYIVKDLRETENAVFIADNLIKDKTCFLEKEDGTQEEAIVVSNGKYIIKKDGLFLQQSNGDFIRIGGYINVVDLIKDSKGNICGKVFEFFDKNDKLKTVNLTNEDLADDKESIRQLTKAGYQI